jgi:DNA-binding protein YbaB
MSQDDPFAEVAVMLGELQRIMSDAREVGELLVQQVDGAQGCDDTGNVVVVIDADNHIVQTSLKPSWHHDIDPPKLSDAVGEADESALERRDLLLTKLIDQAEKAGGPVAPISDYQADIDRATQASGEPTRTPTQLVQDFLAWKSAPEKHSAHGENEGGTVAVVVTEKGFSHCGIDHEWALERDSSAVAAGVVQASADAKDTLEKKTKTRKKPVSALDFAADAIRIFRQLS